MIIRISIKSLCAGAQKVVSMNVSVHIADFSFANVL